MELIHSPTFSEINIIPISFRSAQSFVQKLLYRFPLFRSEKKDTPFYIPLLARVNPLNTDSAVNSVKNNWGYNRDHRKGNACNRPFANFHPRFALVYTRDQNSGGKFGGAISQRAYHDEIIKKKRKKRRWKSIATPANALIVILLTGGEPGERNGEKNNETFITPCFQ